VIDNKRCGPQKALYFRILRKQFFQEIYCLNSHSRFNLAPLPVFSPNSQGRRALLDTPLPLRRACASASAMMVRSLDEPLEHRQQLQDSQSEVCDQTV